MALATSARCACCAAHPLALPASLHACCLLAWTTHVPAAPGMRWPAQQGPSPWCCFGTLIGQRGAPARCTSFHAGPPADGSLPRLPRQHALRQHHWCVCQGGAPSEALLDAQPCTQRGHAEGRGDGRWCIAPAAFHAYLPACPPPCAACCVGCATWQRNFNLVPRFTLRWGAHGRHSSAAGTLSTWHARCLPPTALKVSSPVPLPPGRPPTHPLLQPGAGRPVLRLCALGIRLLP